MPKSSKAPKKQAKQRALAPYVGRIVKSMDGKMSISAGAAVLVGQMSVHRQPLERKGSCSCGRAQGTVSAQYLVATPWPFRGISGAAAAAWDGGELI